MSRSAELLSAAGRVEWSGVLRALGRSESRSYALDRLKMAGFSAVFFSDKSKGKGRSTREAVASALTRTEDWLELEHPGWLERGAVRACRRRLEWELFA